MKSQSQYQMKLQFKTASIEDAQAIALLVNRAYRPNGDVKGWTHESELISGERTNVEQVSSLFGDNSYILVAVENGNIVACVYLEIHGLSAHIGMLATNPELQGLGCGKQMLFYAEEFASKNFSVTKYVMKVLLARKELLDFYTRRGYIATGSTFEYPVSAGVGSPKVTNLQVGILEKMAKISYVS
ncbi:MAG TPA: GNAT family N-acetyltransferase [Methylotenera sp.]|nr:GNAT family N-acetyltransferase [Methylotenera sp.]